MKFNGTPGKWFIMEGGFNKKNSPYMVQIYATNNDLEMVCKVFEDKMLHKRNQNFNANARLIAAAPDLFKIVVDRYQNMTGLKAQNRLNENGLREYESIKKIINNILKEN